MKIKICCPFYSIHICVTLQHVPIVDDFVKDLKESVQIVSKYYGV